MTDDHPELIEIAAGHDLAAIEVAVARLRADGIEARIEPDDTGVLLDDRTGGYRVLLRAADLPAARPVLDVAGITPPPGQVL